MSISEELHKGEKILKTISPSPWAYFGWYFASAIFGLLTIVGFLGIILVELIRRGNVYYITDRRVIHEFTFLSRRISSALYEKIQDLHFSQGVIERIVGIGTIHINTAGTNYIEIKFKGVKDPVSVKRMIEDLTLKRHKK